MEGHNRRSPTQLHVAHDWVAVNDRLRNLSSVTIICICSDYVVNNRVSLVH